MRHESDFLPGRQRVSHWVALNIFRAVANTIAYFFLGRSAPVEDYFEGVSPLHEPLGMQVTETVLVASPGAFAFKMTWSLVHKHYHREDSVH